MSASEDPTNSNPASKTARDQALTRLVSLLKGLESAPTASGAVYRRYQTQINWSDNAFSTIKAMNGGNIHESDAATS